MKNRGGHLDFFRAHFADSDIFEAENAHSKDSRNAYLDDNENSGDTDRGEETACHGKTKRGEAKTEQGKRFREVVKE